MYVLCVCNAKPSVPSPAHKLIAFTTQSLQSDTKSILYVSIQKQPQHNKLKIGYVNFSCGFNLCEIEVRTFVDV